MSNALLPVGPSQSFVPAVPRVICIGLGAFGQQVLHSLGSTYLPAYPPQSTRLTVALSDPDGRGFRRFPLALNEMGPSDAPGDGAAPQPNLQLEENLAQQLYLLRRRVASQTAHAELLQQGYRVIPTTEVYLFVRTPSPTEVVWLQQVARVTRAYLQQFEEVRLTAFVCLADIETPMTQQGVKAAVIDALEGLLIARQGQHELYSGDPLLDRCYIVSPETATSQTNGNAHISDDDLALRTAGFLAAHYVQGLRQPMTIYEHLLFGSRQTGAGLTGGQPIVHLFGYNELRFEFNPIIDWCATRQAQIVINQELLRAVAPTPARESDAATDGLQRLSQQLRAAGLPTTAAEQQQLLHSRVAEPAGGQYEPGDLSPQERLDFWRERRRIHERIFYAAEDQLEKAAHELGERYSEAFGELLNDEAFGEVASLSRADALLTTIEAWCQAGMTDLGRASRESSLTGIAAREARLAEAWQRLYVVAARRPAWSDAAPQIGLLVVSAVALSFAGLVGLAAAGLLLVTGLAWAAYLLWWSPRRLQSLQQAYKEQLDSWRSEQLAQATKGRLEMMYRRLIRQVAPVAVGPESGSMRSLVADWRACLRRAADICADRAARLASASATPSLNAGLALPSDRLVVSAGELQDYYERLTVWQPAEVAAALLGQFRHERVALQKLSAEQLSGRLLSLCRQFYEQRTDVQISGLERHLREVADASPAVIANLLAAMAGGAAPMARTHRLHGYWEQPTLRLLLVNNAEQSIFREPARQLDLTLVSGAGEQQVICICTEHMVSLRDLALTHDWRRSLAPQESEQAHV